MTSQSIFELGLQSFQDLGQEFASTILGTGPTGQTSVVCAATETSATDLQTAFYLNPFDSHECAGSDWVVLLLLGIIIHAVSWGTRWLIWEPLSNWRMRGHKTWDISQRHRLSQTATSLLFFCSSAFFVARVLMSKEWLFSREEWNEQRLWIDADFKFYYLVYAARFFSDLVSIFFEDRKFDAFVAAFIHHVVTLCLVLGSAHCGLIRFGGVIMFFFDWADIPLLIAKICKYISKDPQDAFQFVANRLFESFAVTFFATRNGYFNYVVYAVWMDLSNTFANQCCQYLCLLLVVLQTYWLYLIVMAVVRQQKTGGNVEDVREKDD